MNFRSPFIRFLYKSALTIVLLIGFALLMDKVVMPLYTSGGSIVKVPDVRELDRDSAMAALTKAGLIPKSGYNRYDKTRELNTVLNQNPVAGSEVKRGRHVYLSVNKKSEKPVGLPDYKGRALSDIKVSLEKLGLEMGNIAYSVVYDEDKDGLILSQSIPPKTLLDPGTKIGFTVGKMAESSGQKQSLIPELTGTSLREAQKIIVSNSFTMGAVSFRYSTKLIPNTIINQSPEAGQVAPLGKPINIVVATDKQSSIN